MLPDDESSRQVQKYRAREWLLAAALGFCALGSTLMYLTFLRSLGGLLLTVLIALEWLVMLFVFLIATSRIRRRRR
jgi:hypothetical protein